MYGRTYWGLERSTFVIDSAGKLKAIFRKVKVDGHTEEVLGVLKA
jgi:peroxiredoxin Q/BCP